LTFIFSNQPHPELLLLAIISLMVLIGGDFHPLLSAAPSGDGALTSRLSLVSSVVSYIHPAKADSFSPYPSSHRHGSLRRALYRFFLDVGAL
jgi:hypothetical protein